jgi:hypothetical protein
VPVLCAEGDCDPARREANRVREVACVEVCRLDDLKPGCWPAPSGDPDHCHHDDCADQVPGPVGVCLTPECPCGKMVPLAVISPQRVHEAGQPDRYVISAEQIDTTGRHQLPPPRDFLTHIVHINWPHGGEVTLRDMKEKMKGRLIVSFDRKLKPGEGVATGINRYTFRVEYGGVQKGLEFLPFDKSGKDENDQPEPARPYYLEEPGRSVAVYKIDPDYLDPEEGDNIEDNFVYITLKCNFIMDCHGNPVDGDHLSGRLPSGNGSPGGAFESWFRVTSGRRAKEV